ncbi:MAG: translation initiation factor IF-1 [Candidatus Peribacteraceae bacterium]|nr:translation initiation factor IF-1 [Candidatus Peribacteraceae bacterium]
MARHFKIQKQVVPNKKKNAPKADKEVISALGRVTETLPNAEFLIELLDEIYQGHKLKARISGKMRMHHIKIILGDYVKVELNPYDLNRGRLTFRFRSKVEALRESQTNSSSEENES